MVTRQIWDPVNGVWCSAIPAGWTFAEWRQTEDDIVREMIERTPAYQEFVMRLALERWADARQG